jgi:hypothetical protein
MLALCHFVDGRCTVCGHVKINERQICGERMPSPGLGDMVANALSAIGITKGRVEAVVGGPCGCDGRQSAMNAAGAKYFGLPPGSTAPENKG